MAYEGIGVDWTWDSSGDLSASQYLIVKLSTTGKVTVSSQATAFVDQIGVLQDKPGASGRACQVRIGGISKVVCGGTIAVNAAVMSNASGQAIAATTGKYAIGIYIGAAAAASGDIIPVYITTPNYFA